MTNLVRRRLKLPVHTLLSLSCSAHCTYLVVYKQTDRLFVYHQICAMCTATQCSRTTKRVRGAWQTIPTTASARAREGLVGNLNAALLSLRADLAGTRTGPGTRSGIPAPAFFDGYPRTNRPRESPSVIKWATTTLSKQSQEEVTFQMAFVLTEFLFLWSLLYIRFQNVFCTFPNASARAGLTNTSSCPSSCKWASSLLENDRNPNFCYLPKPNILLNVKYSANCRIIGCRIVPTH